MRMWKARADSDIVASWDAIEFENFRIVVEGPRAVMSRRACRRFGALPNHTLHSSPNGAWYMIPYDSMFMWVIPMENEMPEITIEETTFARLQSHAEVVVDSTDTVVNRALDALEGHSGDPAGNEPGGVDHVVDPRRLPNLTPSRIQNSKRCNPTVLPVDF